MVETRAQALLRETIIQEVEGTLESRIEALEGTVATQNDKIDKHITRCLRQSAYYMFITVRLHRVTIVVNLIPHYPRLQRCHRSFGTGWRNIESWYQLFRCQATCEAEFSQV